MYAVQQPHSLTNPTDRYRVILISDWAAYIDGWKAWLPVESEHTDYATAVERALALNNESK